MKEQLKPKRNSPNILDMFTKSEPFEVSAQPITTYYSVIVDETFEAVQQFENIVKVLESANEGDIVEIKLSTDGGSLFAILPLLSAIMNTKAIVIAHAISDVASAGTLVLLAADDVEINPYTTIMFHQVQFGVGGQGSSVEAHVNHTMKASKQLLHDYYQDFFTEKEIEAMFSGKDFWMGKEEFDARYLKRHQTRKARVEAATQAQQESEEAVEAKPTRKKRTKKQTEAVEA